MASFPLTLPTNVGFVNSQWRIVRTTAYTQSPFTYAQQVHSFEGAVWSATVTTAPMSRSQSGQWTSFLMNLEGRRGTFLLGDPDAKTLQGSQSGNFTVNGDHSIGATSIVCDGLDTSETGVIKAGDYIQFGSGATSKLHQVVSDADSDESGNATLEIMPALKSAVSDDATVIVSNTVGVFRMDSDELQWSADKTSIYQISFSCTEVL